MEASVYFATSLLAIEAIYRQSLIRSHQWLEGGDDLFSADFFVLKGRIFLLSFAGSLWFTYKYIHTWQFSQFWKSPSLHSILPIFYMLDPVAALLIGYGLYHGEAGIFIFGVALLSNFFLVQVIQRIFAKKKAKGMWEEILATFKAIIHHMANFYYIDHKEVVILTTIWRSLSMTGHTSQAFHRMKWISERQLYLYTWILSHLRNILLCYILYRCFHEDAVKLGFARSAIGHIGYMISRAGPVFRLGSCYVGDKTAWQGLSDRQRLRDLLSWKYPFLTIEIGSLVGFSVLLLYWRIMKVNYVTHSY